MSDLLFDPGSSREWIDPKAKYAPNGPVRLVGVEIEVARSDVFEKEPHCDNPNCNETTIERNEDAYQTLTAVLAKWHARMEQDGSLPDTGFEIPIAPLQEIEAYGTITYALQGEQAVRLGRFNGGELALGRTKAGWIWASTETALKTACMIANLHIDGIFSLKQGREYVLTPDRLKRRGRLAFSQISNWHAGSGGFDWAQWEDEATMQGQVSRYKGALTQPASYQAPTKRYTALAGPK